MLVLMLILTRLCMLWLSLPSSFFFFLDAATILIYTLSLHDALPIYCPDAARAYRSARRTQPGSGLALCGRPRERSEEHTLNSSHRCISYAVFCLKKKRRSWPTRRPPAHRGQGNVESRRSAAG